MPERAACAQYLRRETLSWAEEFYFGCLAFRFPSSSCWRCARVTDFGGFHGITLRTTTRRRSLKRRLASWQCRGFVAGDHRRGFRCRCRHAGAVRARLRARIRVDIPMARPGYGSHRLRRHRCHLADRHTVDRGRNREATLPAGCVAVGSGRTRTKCFFGIRRTAS